MLVRRVAADAERQVGARVHRAARTAFTSSSVIALRPATVPSATCPYGVPRKMFVCSRSLPSSSSLFDRRSWTSAFSCARLQPLEVLLAPALVEQLRQHDREELLPVVAVDDAGERRHLLVGAGR